MAGLIAYMNGWVGRALRIIVGVALLWYGFVGPGQGTVPGTILGVVGILAAVGGLWRRCLLQYVAGSKA